METSIRHSGLVAWWRPILITAPTSPTRWRFKLMANWSSLDKPTKTMTSRAKTLSSPATIRMAPSTPPSALVAECEQISPVWRRYHQQWLYKLTAKSWSQAAPFRSSRSPAISKWSATTRTDPWTGPLATAESWRRLFQRVVTRSTWPCSPTAKSLQPEPSS